MLHVIFNITGYFQCFYGLFKYFYRFISILHVVFGVFTGYFEHHRFFFFFLLVIFCFIGYFPFFYRFFPLVPHIILDITGLFSMCLQFISDITCYFPCFHRLIWTLKDIFFFCRVFLIIQGIFIFFTVFFQFFRILFPITQL